jgi:hypothetical protein
VPTFRNGDRVTYTPTGAQCTITRLRGGYHADIYFGTLDHKAVIWENVLLDDLSPGVPSIAVDDQLIREKETSRHNGRT